MHYWLLKTDADTYPIEQLQKDTKTPWSGVRNYQARNFMRDTMPRGSQSSPPRKGTSNTS